MRTSTWLPAIGVLILALLAILFVAVPQFRSAQERSAFEPKAADLWTKTAGGYVAFRDQVLSLRNGPDAADQIGHAARANLQTLNALPGPGNVPESYRGFVAEIASAVDPNKRYYRKVNQLATGQAVADAQTQANLTTLAKDAEDAYRRAAQLQPGIASAFEWGVYNRVNETLTTLFKPKEKVQTKIVVIAPPPATQQTPQAEPGPCAFTPSNPPKAGMTVYVDTPSGRGLKLRQQANATSEPATEQAGVVDGEILTVVDRVGDWLEVTTDKDNTGYIRWWHEGNCYVRP